MTIRSRGPALLLLQLHLITLDPERTVIRNPFAPVALFVTSGVAFAHPGHSHVGNEVFHHTMEGVAIAGAVAAIWLLRNRLRRTAKPQTKSARTEGANQC